MVVRDGPMEAVRWRLGVVPTGILAMALVCALLLALPGQTIATKYVNDIFIFLDGAYRITLGQVPNRDFHTALGPLTYYIPALGYLLTGSIGAAMPVGMALVIVALAPILAYVLDSRLSPSIALPFGGLLLLVLAVPINLGERPVSLSFGMYYNRLGWAVVALLLVMYLRPRSEVARPPAADAISAAALTLILLYLKISYGAVALGFLALMLLDPRQRNWAAAAIGIVVLASLLIESVWRSSLAYIADVRLASEVSGAVRGGWGDWLTLGFGNLPDIVVPAMIAAVAVWLSRSMRDLLFYLFCGVAGFLLMNQNFQQAGMITSFAIAAVAAETIRRAGARREGVAKIAAAAPWLLFAYVLPTAVHSAIGLGTHAALAARAAGTPFPLPNFADLRLVDIWSGGDHLFSANYLNSLRNGELLLRDFAPDAQRVFVMDFVTPFSAGLGLEPPRGDSSWQHWGRTSDDQFFIPPEDMLKDVRFVMDPKYPVERWTTEGLRRVYGAYVAENFRLVGENVDWRLYEARDRPAKGDGATKSTSATRH